MTYRLEAHIEDMSRTEATAIVRAILVKHGSKLVEETMKAHEVKVQNQPPNDVAMAT